MRISCTTYLSIQHIQNLSYLVSEAIRLREPFKAEQNDQNRAAYYGICNSGIFTAVAFLEAMINELYTDAASGSNSSHIKVGDRHAVFETLWNQGIPRTARYSVLEKYQLMLGLLSVSSFDRGSLLYQDVDALISLRNALIHYEPEEVVVMSFETEEVTVQKIAKRLASKFEIDRFYNTFGGFFPDKCLCAGAVEWAYKSSLSFADEFFRRIGTTPTYDHVRGAIRKL